MTAPLTVSLGHCTQRQMGKGHCRKKGDGTRQRQLQPCQQDQACQHPTAPALHSWCHSPQQELGRVIEAEHVVIVLHVVLVEQCVQLLQLQQHTAQRLGGYSAISCPQTGP